MLNLDTHMLLFALTGDIKPKERRVLSSQPWSISAIVLWELCKLAQLGRIELDLDDHEFQQVLNSLHVWPLSFAVCRAIHDLDFMSDPADELIAATSVVHRIPLLTRDRKILRSRLVPFATA
jgi:PIN domain nuclease of toxin-antitoxin system